MKEQKTLIDIDIREIAYKKDGRWLCNADGTGEIISKLTNKKVRINCDGLPVTYDYRNRNKNVEVGHHV